MALDAVEQELYDFAMASMPPWYKARDRSKEEVSAMAKQKGAVKKLAAYWLQMCLIGQATGPEAKTAGWDTDWATPIGGGVLGPDWLELHAEDQGTRRANGESDTVMRKRLQMTPDTVTRAAILAATNAMLATAGVSGTADMVEFPRDAAYLGTYSPNTGTGGTFEVNAGIVTFKPTVPFAYPPFFEGVSGEKKSVKIALSGASSSGNNGTFTITSLVVRNDPDGNPTLTAVTYANVSGVAEVDASCSWTTQRIDSDGAVIDAAGTGMAYVNRGYRLGRGQTAAGGKNAMGGIVVMLPYGTTEATRLAVREMLRTRKAAGIAAICERRVTPP